MADHGIDYERHRREDRDMIHKINVALGLEDEDPTDEEQEWLAHRSP